MPQSPPSRSTKSKTVQYKSPPPQETRTVASGAPMLPNSVGNSVMHGFEIGTGVALANVVLSPIRSSSRDIRDGTFLTCNEIIREYEKNARVDLKQRYNDCKK